VIAGDGEVRVPEDLRVIVGVQIDEARRDNLASRIDYLRALMRRDAGRSFAILPFLIPMSLRKRGATSYRRSPCRFFTTRSNFRHDEHLTLKRLTRGQTLCASIDPSRGKTQTERYVGFLVVANCALIGRFSLSPENPHLTLSP